MSLMTSSFPPPPPPPPQSKQSHNINNNDYNNDNDDDDTTSNKKKELLIFDTSLVQKQQALPSAFVWPSGDLASSFEQEELNEPVVDLGGFMRGDEEARARAIRLVREACGKHGFFQVTNHGVDPSLIEVAYEGMDSIFKLPLTKKLSARRQPGGVCGYSGAHADRYTSKLPWKETFSFHYYHHSHFHHSSTLVVDYFNSVLGHDFQTTGWVYEKYCEAMEELSFVIMELLAMSLGVDRLHYREFFEDGGSIMRCNNYPPCNSPRLTLGTGPHSDPTSLTILHQDQVGGLQVFADNKWLAIRPRHDAFVINLGDTFMALSNGRYKSCLHRALVNKEKERRSLVYFVNPREDKIVKPPQNLIVPTKLDMLEEKGRKYPDFTWSDLFHYSQSHYRADVATLQSFILWLHSSNSSKQSLTSSSSSN